MRQYPCGGRFSGQDDHMKQFDRITNPRDVRRRTGLNQQEFWGKIGVTQSGGSRYESGRTMPRPVRELFRLVHVEQVDLTRVRAEDVAIVDHLRKTNPRLYQTMRTAIRIKGRGRTGTPKH